MSADAAPDHLQQTRSRMRTHLPFMLPALVLALPSPSLALCSDTPTPFTAPTAMDHPSATGNVPPQTDGDTRALPKARATGDLFALTMGDHERLGYNVGLAWLSSTTRTMRNAEGTLTWVDRPEGSSESAPITFEGHLPVQGDGEVAVRIEIFDEACFDALLRATFTHRFVIAVEGERVLRGCGTMLTD